MLEDVTGFEPMVLGYLNLEKWKFRWYSGCEPAPRLIFRLKQQEFERPFLSGGDRLTYRSSHPGSDIKTDFCSFRSTTKETCPSFKNL